MVEEAQAALDALPEAARERSAAGQPRKRARAGRPTRPDDSELQRAARARRRRRRPTSRRAARFRQARLRRRQPRRSGRHAARDDPRRSRVERRRGQGQAAADLRGGRAGRSVGRRQRAASSRCCCSDERSAPRLSIFPLSGAILFPGLQLPLHIFEPRYRALVSDALARDRRIAMIQPQALA